MASPHMPSSDMMSQREREAAPGLSQWDPSDLRMMEDRIETVYPRDNDTVEDEDEDEEEDHYGEQEYGGEVSQEHNDHYDEYESSR